MNAESCLLVNCFGSQIPFHPTHFTKRAISKSIILFNVEIKLFNSNSLVETIQEEVVFARPVVNTVTLGWQENNQFSFSNYNQGQKLVG